MVNLDELLKDYVEAAKDAEPINEEELAVLKDFIYSIQCDPNINVIINEEEPNKKKLSFLVTVDKTPFEEYTKPQFTKDCTNRDIIASYLENTYIQTGVSNLTISDVTKKEEEEWTT